VQAGASWLETNAAATTTNGFKADVDGLSPQTESETRCTKDPAMATNPEDNANANKEPTSVSYSNPGVAGIVGPHGKVEGSTFIQQQGPQILEHVDMHALHDELEKLAKKLSFQSTTPDQRIDAAVVEQAAQSAKAGDKEGIIASLKRASKWVLDVATEIGTKIATEVILKATGLK
jgi:hypothetical protein